MRYRNPILPVFHSRDLAHWNQIGNAIDRNGQLNFDNEGISRGLFAPTIRYSGGIFYILSEHSGRLRLYTRAATLKEKKHPAFAGLRLKHKDWQFSACFEFAPKNRGECAGIALLQGDDYQYRLEACFLETVSVRLIRACGKADEVLAVQPFPEYGGGLGGGVSGNVSGGENAPSFVLAVLEEGLNMSFFYGKTRDALKRLACNIDGSILSTEYSGGFVGTVAGVFASGNRQDSPNYADVAWAEYCENC